jgi:hypothetical protein
MSTLDKVLDIKDQFFGSQAWIWTLFLTTIGVVLFVFFILPLYFVDGWVAFAFYLGFAVAVVISETGRALLRIRP